jgi:hypothetical protein
MVVDVDVGIGPWGWVFVDEPDFIVINVVHVVHTHARNTVHLSNTRVVHRPERGDDDRVVNRGIDPRIVERASGQRVIAKRVVALDDGRAQRALEDDAGGAVTIRRARAIEQRVRERDVPAPVDGRAAAPDDVDVRPLRAPDGDDALIERRFDDEKRRAVERHELERRAPAPAGPPPNDGLQRGQQQQQQRELEELERAKQKEKAARDKKKSTPRKVYPTKKKPTRTLPSAPGAPPSAPADER